MFQVTPNAKLWRRRHRRSIDMKVVPTLKHARQLAKSISKERRTTVEVLCLPIRMVECFYQNGKYLAHK